MNIIMRFLGYGLLLVLAGCKTYQGFSLNNQVLLACQKACWASQKICQTQCQNNIDNCESAASQNTKKMFCRYKHEQYIQGNIVARELKSYRDPLQCRKITCDCWADYRVCRAACTPIIHKRLQTLPVD